MPSEPAPGISLRARQREGWAALKAFLFPGEAEQDPGFREEVQRRSVRGLYIIAGVTALMPVLGYLFHILANVFEPAPLRAPIVPVLLFCMGGLMVGAARTQWGLRHARMLAFSEGVGVATILIWSCLLGARSITTDPVVSSLIDVIIVLVVALTAIPARPMQMAGFGWGLAWINFLSAVAAVQLDLIPRPSLHYFAAVDLIVLLLIVLAGLNDQLVHGSYLAQLDRLSSHARLLHSETALSFSRLSATLSHELNSPIGAIGSSVESLKTLHKREEADPGLDRERTNEIREGLLDSAQKAVAKLTEITGRIERFTNLDRAESVSVEIDKMLQDVAHMVSPDGDHARIALQLGKLPKLTLKPQPISSVFSRLMQNALRANTNGEPITVDASVEDGEIVVTVRDRGEGLPDKELRSLFEPGFRTRGSRVGASNWGLFTARQIVREHGGEISAARAEGGGTAVSVRLPLDAPASSLPS